MCLWQPLAGFHHDVTKSTHLKETIVVTDGLQKLSLLKYDVNLVDD